MEKKNKPEQYYYRESCGPADEKKKIKTKGNTEGIKRQRPVEKKQ
jgi:hypothetical protein